jgi:tetratricopeptide (TPR) repeat protein
MLAAYIASGATDKDQLVRAHAVRAMAFSAIRNLDSALAELDEAVKIDATKPNSYFMRAAAHEAQKDYDKALADLDEAIRLDATHAEYYLLRGIVYRDKGDLDRALVEINENIRLDPGSLVGYSKRGDLYRQRKEYDLSVADYDQVIKIEREGARGYIDRGWIFVLKNDLEAAPISIKPELHQNDGAGRLRPNKSCNVKRPTAAPTSLLPRGSNREFSTRSASSASSSGLRRLSPRAGNWAIRA